MRHCELTQIFEKWGRIQNQSPRTYLLLQASNAKEESPQWLGPLCISKNNFLGFTIKEKLRNKKKAIHTLNTFKLLPKQNM